MGTMWVLLAFVCVVPCNSFISERHPSLPPFILGRPHGGFMKTSLMNMEDSDGSFLSADYPNVQTFNITQPVDQFDPKNKATWTQRVQYNPSFYKNNSLIFFMLGGESEAYEKWVGKEDIMYLQWAKKYGAAVFQVEHRFFGFSRPYPTMSTEALKYCTTEQALADFANFITLMNVKFNYTNPRWVVFGGSYPGSLAAFFRSKYPHLTVGAVASSAPLNLKLDFYEYAMVVEKTLETTDPICREKTGKAFELIQKLILTKEGRDQLNTAFLLDPKFDDATVTPLALQNFIANLYTVFQGVVQYTYDGGNNRTKNGLDVKNLCKQITTADAANPLAQIKAVIDWVNSFTPPSNCKNDISKCTFANSYEDMVKVLANETYDDPSTSNAAMRGWMWLCCNEIGFLQTTDQGRNIFGQMVPLNYYTDMCVDLFGNSVNAKNIRDNNAAAQKYYGGTDNFQATNVVLPNGSLDPWHSLGKLDADENNHIVPVVIQGTAHCADMYPPYANEPAALKDARIKIENELASYIKQS